MLSRGGAQGLVRLGDPVEGGGQVTTATGFLVGGRPLMRVGDLAECATHGGSFPAVEGYDGLIVDGCATVLDRHRLACGCRVLSSCNNQWGHEPVPSVAKAPHATTALSFAQAPAPEMATRLDDAQPTQRMGEAGVILRIGLFFEGTNNNAINTALGNACREKRRR